MTRIILPNDWSTRVYQEPAWNAIVNEGYKRLCLPWHRRAGKDSLGMNVASVLSQERVGLYWHMLPKQTQARKVVWRGIDRTGRRMIDQAFPSAMRKPKGTHETDMLIEMRNGSMWQAVGSDNYEALIGGNPIFICMSEYSVADPQAWNFLRPILLENEGIAMFIYTARQRNHGYVMAKMAEKNPKWFFQKLTVDDTKRPDGSPVIGPDAIQEERDSGMSDAMVRQEYYVDFNAMNDGALFGKELEAAHKNNRIGHYPANPALPVHTFWDIGVNDRTAIVMVQATQGRIFIVGHYSNRDRGMAFYIRTLKDWARVNEVTFGKHFGPHDIKVREYGDPRARTRQAIALQDHKFRFEVTPNMLLADQMEAARVIFPKLHINTTPYEYDTPSLNECTDALESAHREKVKSSEGELDEGKHTYKDAPEHDWTSHTVSAVLNMSVNMRDWMFDDQKDAPTNFTKPAVMKTTQWNPL